MEYIKGTNRSEQMLFPESFDEYVDENNPVRVIEVYVNQLDLEGVDIKNFQPNETGRPMYDPRDLLKLYIYGYMNRVRSTRRLERETYKNIEVIWLLKRLHPDHKTISRFRQKNAWVLKAVFKDFVSICMKFDLYGKSLVAIVVA